MQNMLYYDASMVDRGMVAKERADEFARERKARNALAEWGKVNDPGLADVYSADPSTGLKVSQVVNQRDAIKRRGQAETAKMAADIFANVDTPESYAQAVKYLAGQGAPVQQFPQQYDPNFVSMFRDKAKAVADQFTYHEGTDEQGNPVALSFNTRTGEAKPLAGVAPKPATPKNVQTISTAEGVFIVNPDGSTGKRLGSPVQQFVQVPSGYQPVEGGLKPIPGGPADPSQPKPQKPLPPGAVRMQQEELDAIGTASTLAADIGSLRKQIDDGKLTLGPVSNLVAQGRNYVGASTENSRNYASFKATLEKLRNDSLRLNKGVQTEGDAVRAWNEILANTTDPKLVSQRLSEIEAINKRAIDLRKLNLDNLMATYGRDPVDITPYLNQKPVVGQGSLPGNEEELSKLSDDEVLRRLGVRK